MEPTVTATDTISIPLQNQTGLDEAQYTTIYVLGFFDNVPKDVKRGYRNHDCGIRAGSVRERNAANLQAGPRDLVN